MVDVAGAEKIEGKVVRDSAGRKVGRLEEVIADREGRIQEYVLGKQGLWERLGVVGMSLIFLGRKRKGKHIPWDRMDLRELKLTCTLEELEHSP